MDKYIYCLILHCWVVLLLVKMFYLFYDFLFLESPRAGSYKLWVGEEGDDVNVAIRRVDLYSIWILLSVDATGPTVRFLGGTARCRALRTGILGGIAGAGGPSFIKMQVAAQGRSVRTRKGRAMACVLWRVSRSLT